MENMYSTMPVDSISNDLRCFVEDVFHCVMWAHQIEWQPVCNYSTNVNRIFCSAIGNVILKRIIHLRKHRTVEHFENLSSRIGLFRDCQEFMNWLGGVHFHREPFHWNNFTTFLATVNQIALQSVRKDIFLVDNLALCTAEYAKSHLLSCIDILGGWFAFKTYCVRITLYQDYFTRKRSHDAPAPSAPSECLSDPLLNNEHPVDISNPPCPPPRMNMDSAVQVLPTHFPSRHNLRPVHCTFNMGESV